MSRGGRPNDPVWKFFKTIEEGGKVTKAKYIKCDTFVSAKPCRLRAHLAKCNSNNSEETLSISLRPTSKTCMQYEYSTTNE